MSVALNFQQTGNLDAPAVVLLGSLGSDLSMWQPQIHALSNRYRVIAVDHRGHGKSPVPAGPYSIADLAGDVIALLDSLELESVHLVGLSLGGAVSQWIAAHHPTRVETLTLMCTSSQFAPAQPWIDRARAVRADGIASIAAAVVGRWFTPGLAENDPELVARHVAMVEATPDEGYAACCEALSTWDGRNDLARIVAPTLLVAGEQDRTVQASTVVASFRLHRRSVAVTDLHVYPGRSHLLITEPGWEAIADACIDWAREQLGGF